MNSLQKSIFLILILLFTTISYGQQSKTELEKQKRRNEKEMRLTKKLLKAAKTKTKKSYNNYLLIRNQIKIRNRQIELNIQELKIIKTEITKQQTNIEGLERKLKTLKTEYAKMIYYTYKNKDSYDKLMFVLSSEDFNQAYKRLKYFQQYSDYRKKQAREIISQSDSLSIKIIELDKRKKSQKKLIQEQIVEKEKLVTDKQEQNEILVHLKSEEKKLKDKVAEKKRRVLIIQKQINKIIAAEAERIRKASLKNKANKTNKKSFGLTPEQQLISTNFGKNKGRLPWPTERGIVTETFGKHEHPGLKGIITQNNGIDISTEQGSFARSVFEGEVIKVFQIPGTPSKAIIVKHGEYLCVYTNLSNTLVNDGDKIKAKQKIGTIYTDEDGTTIIHLEIWKGKEKFNPQRWISK